ncbi:hypothetical protein B296_00013232 [Ensete ventricosum]|uniref:Uncharacterized protein n=1 Tax=Ensete ventricosum TaxID=4639 RepID=A0A426ZE11_ENSVE|nr:hypothetical protein B296_00013232 [Ensete ventricosum]
MAVCISSRSSTLHRWLHKCSFSVGSASAAVAVAVAWKKGKVKKLCLLPMNCTPLEQNPKTEQERVTEEEEEVGYVLCSKCKVFKCITFPDYSDGALSAKV